jgi:hypothetical protein
VEFSPRALLRTGTSRQDVLNYAREMGWPNTLEEGDPGQGQNYRAAFAIVPGSGTSLHYVEDFTSRQRYVYVSSTELWLASRMATFVDDDLDPETLDDLLATCDTSTGLDHGRALMRLGVAAPYEFSPDVYARLSAGMKDTDPRVRRLSMWATTYSPWPQYLDHIHAIADADPDDALRDRAATILAVLQERG